MTRRDCDLNLRFDPAEAAVLRRLFPPYIPLYGSHRAAPEVLEIVNEKNLVDAPPLARLRKGPESLSALESMIGTR